MYHYEMMPMWFHFGLGDTLLFKNWTLNSEVDLILACLIFFVFAMFYEWIKNYRNVLFQRRKSKLRKSLSMTNNKTTNDLAVIEVNGDDGALQNNSIVIKKFISLSFYDYVQAVLHIIQVMISYTLMLGFMSFNVCICLSILVGAGIGYLLFCSLKEIDLTDHCH